MKPLACGCTAAILLAIAIVAAGIYQYKHRNDPAAAAQRQAPVAFAPTPGKTGSAKLGAWGLERVVDEFTDAPNYALWIDGGKIAHRTSLLDYRPRLIVWMTPKSYNGIFLDCDYKVGFVLAAHDSFSEMNPDVAVRFDFADPLTVAWRPLAGMSGAIAPESLDMVSRLKRTRRLRLKITTVFGTRPVLDFDVSGFASALRAAHEYIFENHAGDIPEVTFKNLPPAGVGGGTETKHDSGDGGR